MILVTIMCCLNIKSAHTLLAIRAKAVYYRSLGNQMDAASKLMSILNRIVCVLTKWCNAALVWDGMPAEFEGAKRYGGNGPYCYNIVLERQMTRTEAVQVRNATIAHFNEELGGPYLSWKLCEMDKASFEGGWTFLP